MAWLTVSWESSPSARAMTSPAVAASPAPMKSAPAGAGTAGLFRMGLSWVWISHPFRPRVTMVVWARRAWGSWSLDLRLSLAIISLASCSFMAAARRGPVVGSLWASFTEVALMDRLWAASPYLLEVLRDYGQADEGPLVLTNEMGELWYDTSHRRPGPAGPEGTAVAGGDDGLAGLGLGRDSGDDDRYDAQSVEGVFYLLSWGAGGSGGQEGGLSPG